MPASADTGDDIGSRRNRAAVGWLWRGLAFAVTTLRFPILLAWIAAAVGASLYLPSLAASNGIGGLIPSGSAAIRAEYDAARLFGFPLSAQVDVVQSDPHGFTSSELVAFARRAAAVDTKHVTAIPGLAGALPVPNSSGVPGARGRHSSTIVTFLFFRPATSITEQTAGGQAYARRFLGAPADHLAGVTGPAPAQQDQGVIIQRYLPWVELATVLAIALIVGLYFRSAGAPLATLLCAGVAYLVAVRVVAWAGQRAGLTLPPDLEPVLVVLLLGVTTDYTVFYLAAMRTSLEEGLGRIAAARRATAETTPIILTAGLVVTAGIASLAAARLAALRAFGPGLALTVLIAMAVASTLAPALIAIFGSLLFRPGPARLRRAATARAAPPGNGTPPAGRGRALDPARGWRSRVARLATTRPVALLVTAACVAGLLITALGLTQVRLGFPLIRALPDTAAPARAETAASRGFAPGILSPTEVLVLGPGVTRQRAALARLQHELAGRPGVAGVVGPADVPPDVPPVQQALRLTLARSGDAARYGVVEQTDPLGATAISQVHELRQELPTLARRAGLTGVRVEVGGETALAGEAIDSAQADIGRVALAIGLAVVLLLAIFLRALVAPLYLLAASVLALLSSLGLTVWIFQDVLGYAGIVYYVPFIVAVLLISLGSDYNVFVVGRIWEEARRLPLREAVAVAAPRASRAITTAGLALAAGFGVLALVPLDQFREIAVAMALGIVIDTFVVRSLLVPALVVLFGRMGSWPARLHTRPAPRPPARTREPLG